jgi:histone acetyltransferase (RNA polymerase elongator complex component)
MHYLTYVMIKNTGIIEGEVAVALAPFDEELQVEPYRRYLKSWEVAAMKIVACRHGKCIWCLQETEVVQAEFQDGLVGLLCKKHVWQALGD